MFIGRASELKFLESRYAAPGGQLVVLYGRRRFGKTTTLREFCKGKKHLFFSCTQSLDGIQLARFSEAVLRDGHPAARYITSFRDWTAAFKALADLPYGDERRLVVLDEFPYMCKGNPGIPSELQNLWDLELRDKNIMLVLCGSSMSFIEKELLTEKNPLYGRATGIYKMKPMGFYEAMRFFPNYSPRDKVMTYAVLGGIPHYLKQFDPDRSPEDNIRQAILTPGAALYSETDFLLHQELRETASYNGIITAVALGNTKLNDIAQKSLLNEPGKTSIYLRNLMELGLVEREFPVNATPKEHANGRRGIYRISDAFFRFWYAFAMPNYSFLEAGDADLVYEHVIGPELHRFASHVFEDVCREFLMARQRAGSLPFWFNRIGRWIGKTTLRDESSPSGRRIDETEIDLLAVSPDDAQYLVGECKFKKTPFSYGEYLDTVAKLGPLKEKKCFFYALFSESGFDERLLRLAGTDDTLLLFGLDTIVNAPDPR